MRVEREKTLQHTDFCLEPAVFMTEDQSSMKIFFLVCEGFDCSFAEAVCVSDCEVSRKNSNALGERPMNPIGLVTGGIKAFKVGPQVNLNGWMHPEVVVGGLP